MPLSDEACMRWCESQTDTWACEWHSEWNGGVCGTINPSKPRSEYKLEFRASWLGKGGAAICEDVAVLEGEEAGGAATVNPICKLAVEWLLESADGSACSNPSSVYEHLDELFKAAGCDELAEELVAQRAKLDYKCMSRRYRMDDPARRRAFCPVGFTERHQYGAVWCEGSAPAFEPCGDPFYSELANINGNYMCVCRGAGTVYDSASKQCGCYAGMVDGTKEALGGVSGWCRSFAELDPRQRDIECDGLRASNPTGGAYTLCCEVSHRAPYPLSARVIFVVAIAFLSLTRCSRCPRPGTGEGSFVAGA